MHLSLDMQQSMHYSYVQSWKPAVTDHLNGQHQDQYSTWRQEATFLGQQTSYHALHVHVSCITRTVLCIARTVSYITRTVSCIARTVSCIARTVLCIARTVSCIARTVSCIARTVSCIAHTVSCIARTVSCITCSNSIHMHKRLPT